MYRNIFFTLLLLCIQISSAQSETLDSAFSTPADMTDEQLKSSQEFTHEGRKGAIIAAACESAKDSKNCSQDVDSVGSVLGKNLGFIENQIGKLYGMLFGGSAIMSGKGPTVGVVSKKKFEKGMSKEDKKENSEQKGDYCLYAAIGYEMVGGFWQTSLQDKIVKNTESLTDLQLKSLTALKETHLARKKTASFQSLLYGSTSACYIARAAASKGRVVMDPKYYAKMIGAGALSTLYALKAKKHRLAADAVQNVIDKLPKVGSCNPWTDSPCFCGEPTSKTLYPDMYQEVCVLNGGDPNTPKTAMGCGVLTDGKMTYDRECRCKITNTCYRANLSKSDVKFAFGANYMADANKGFGDLASGEFDLGKFDASSMQFGVNASKIKGKIATTSPLKNPKLSAEEKKFADSMKGLVPPAVAGLIAQSPSHSPNGFASNAGPGSALAKVPKELKEKIQATEDPKYSGNGGGYSEHTENAPTFNIPGSSEGEGGDSAEVLTFAERAINNADVTRAPEKPIFDIISDRYKRSAIHLNQ